ncbi:hypothetical protein L1I79_38735 [Strepomyces sp. STD 3.1]|nr:hypothetical protein [Streptomyces sp. STD 3.1]
MDSKTKIDKQMSTSKESSTQSWVQSSKWGYISSVILLPYAIFKTMWALKVPVGTTEDVIEGMHTNMETYSGPVFSFLYQYGIDITALLAVIAIFLSLALVRPWGQRFPMWLPIFRERKVPRWLILFPAWTGGVLFIVFGGFSVFELILLGLGIGSDNMDGLEPWVFMITYGGFFIWGLTTCLAALSYQIRTRNIKAENN